MPFSQPMPLGRKAEPFDHSEWIYELKYDGFRALAVVEYGRCALFSRNGHPFASFSELASRIGYAVMPRSMVMDGEIVCLDKDGRCQFNDLLFRRGDPCFIAFDLLEINGRDLRRERLIDRKHELQRITSGLSRMVYADHIERTGIALFKKACELDLEGIVAKDGRAPYDPQRSTWFKIRNRNYSQLAGREELFERERHAAPVPGWHTCTLATAAAVK
jgi:bifunctional non-homologous end joining protein LigD